MCRGVTPGAAVTHHSTFTHLSGGLEMEFRKLLMSLHLDETPSTPLLSIFDLPGHFPKLDVSPVEENLAGPVPINAPGSGNALVGIVPDSPDCLRAGPKRLATRGRLRIALETLVGYAGNVTQFAQQPNRTNPIPLRYRET